MGHECDRWAARLPPGLVLQLGYFKGLRHRHIQRQPPCRPEIKIFHRQQFEGQRLASLDGLGEFVVALALCREVGRLLFHDVMFLLEPQDVEMGRHEHRRDPDHKPARQEQP